MQRWRGAATARVESLRSLRRDRKRQLQRARADAAAARRFHRLLRWEEGATATIRLDDTLQYNQQTELVATPKHAFPGEIREELQNSFAAHSRHQYASDSSATFID